MTINECTPSQLISILQTNEIFNDEAINKWKPQIIKYLRDYKIDGNKLLNTKRKTFGQTLVTLNEKKIRGPAHKTHDRFVKLNDKMTASKSSDNVCQ